MNKIVRVCLTSSLCIFLLLEFLWVMHWYSNHATGRRYLVETRDRINNCTERIRMTHSYMKDLNNKLDLWRTSHILHEDNARRKFGYIMPGEYVYICSEKE